MEKLTFAGVLLPVAIFAKWNVNIWDLNVRPLLSFFSYCSVSTLHDDVLSEEEVSCWRERGVGGVLFSHSCFMVSRYSTSVWYSWTHTPTGGHKFCSDQVQVWADGVFNTLVNIFSTLYLLFSAHCLVDSLLWTGPPAAVTQHNHQQDCVQVNRNFGSHLNDVVLPKTRPFDLPHYYV